MKITREQLKQIIKEEKNHNLDKDNSSQNIEVVKQIKELKNLYDNGILNEEEFRKAKDKILK